MLRAPCLALTLLVLPLGPASADGPPDRGANAALKYWQAFATLPRLTDAEQRKLNTEYLTMPLDGHAREIVAKAEYALQMLRRGAALRRCDWGVGYEDGFYLRCPHADGARVLCSLACLRARLRFEEGKSADAVEDLVAALTLSRHVSQDGILLMVVFGYSIEHRIDDTLARYLPRLDAGMIEGLKTRLDALPAGGRPAAAMRYEEKSFLDWFVREVKAAKDKESLAALLSPLFHDEGDPNGRPSLEKGRAFLQACGGTAEAILRHAEETRSSYALMAKKLDLPLEQFEKKLERETKKRADNPAFKVFFPALRQVRRAQARAEVRRALLAAALAVRLDGRDALKQHPDPVVGGAFEYVPFEGGFELRSRLKGQDDKPVTLTAGRRGQ